MLVRSLALAALASSLTAQSWLQAPLLFDPAMGEVRAVADLDRDGDLDLLCMAGSSSGGVWTSMTPHLNQGNGVFTAGATQPLPAHIGPYHFLGDFDGDQQTDLVTSAAPGFPGGPGLLFHRGLPGPSFAAPVHLGLGANPLQIRPGRGNNDAMLDLAVLYVDPAVAGYAVRWLFGRSGQTPALQPLLALTGLLPEGFAAFDRDLDGDDDLAVSGNNLVALFQNQNGVMSAAGTLPLPSSSIGSLVGVDLDGDLDGDLLAFTFGGLQSLVITRMVNQGGTLVPTSQTFTSTSGSYHPGDWDGDGDVDVMMRFGIGPAGGLTLFSNGGNSGFAMAWSKDWGLPYGNSVAGCLDLDGDGHLDFVDVRSIVYGDGTLAPLTGPSRYSIHAPTDWDDDGDLDIPYQLGELWRNDGRGVFASEQFSWPTIGTNQFFGGEVLFADFDGDGLREALVPLFQRLSLAQSVFQRMHRFEDDGAGRFVDLGPATPLFGQPMGSLAFAVDTDGDGLLDVVDGNGVWANSGAHTFTLQAQSFGSYRPIVAGDVDGDGRTDFLAAHLYSTQGLAILRQNGPHTFAIQPVYPTISSTLTYHVPAFADLDDDGDLDIAVDTSWASGQIEIWLNQGGQFGPAPALTFSWPGQPIPTTVLAGDLDGDGRTDLAVSLNVSKLRILRRIGPGLVYDPPRDFIVDQARRLADIDGDGDLDVLGGETVFNRRFHGPAAGQRRQYGAAAPGTGGVRPVLGCAGPMRTGLAPVLRLRQARGGTFSVLGMGLQESNVTFPASPGLVAYTYPLALTLGFVTSGPTGVARAGALDHPLLIPPGFSGTRLWFQHFVFDPAAPSGIVHTNGLEFTVGQ